MSQPSPCNTKLEMEATNHAKYKTLNNSNTNSSGEEKPIVEATFPPDILRSATQRENDQNESNNARGISFTTLANTQPRYACSQDDNTSVPVDGGRRLAV